jgi:hypothetical protein
VLGAGQIQGDGGLTSARVISASTFVQRRGLFFFSSFSACVGLITFWLYICSCFKRKDFSSGEGVVAPYPVTLLTGYQFEARHWTAGVQLTVYPIAYGL